MRDECPVVWPDDGLDLIGIYSANDGKLDAFLDSCDRDVRPQWQGD